MLIDTHCHINIMLRGYQTKLHFVPFSNEEISNIETIINNAKNNNVTRIINVGTDLVESITCIKIAQLFSHNFAIIGLHPNDATKNWKEDIKEFALLLKEKTKNKIVGIGECGIDMHYPNYNLERQRDVFKAQIELALQHNLPLSIHSRDASEETFEILSQYQKEDNLRGVMHCFSYTADYAQEAINLNFVLGIGGTVTYPKNEHFRSIVKETPLDQIVLETDSPFLPPQSIRGKKNSPQQIDTIAQFIADLKNISYQEVAEQTTATAKKLFSLS